MPANPRTIILCIALFLASALITLTLKETASHLHSSQDGSSRTSWLHNLFPAGRKSGHAQHSNQHPVAAPRVAFATFLAGNANPDALATDADSEAANDNDDGYYLGARVLAYALLHSPATRSSNDTTSSSHIPFIIACTTDVSVRKRKRLKKDGATVIVVDKLRADWVQPNTPRWADVLSKLRLFELTQYTKICFIDADTLVTGRLDGVFRDEATLTQSTLPNPEGIKSDEAALPRTYMLASHIDYWGYDHGYPPPTSSADGTGYLNCGFFVFTPSKTLFNHYISILQLPGRFDPGFPEQNLLNYAHRRDGNMPWKPLWYGWNVNWPTEKDWRGGARSFHAKYWDGDPSHDAVLKALWREQRAEMEGFYRGRDEAGVRVR